MLFKKTFFQQNLTRCKYFNWKSDASHIFYLKNWRIVKILVQNLTRFKTFSPRSDFYLVFQVLTESWYFQSTLLTAYFKEDYWKTMGVMVSRQMDNWKLPHVNWSLNGWGIPLWQHTIFTEVTDRTPWIIKCSRSAVFLKIHLCENKRKRCLVRILSDFSNVFVWATRRRAMERSWHLHSIYPILAAGRYLPKSWHLSKPTMLNRKSNFKTCVAQNIP